MQQAIMDWKNLRQGREQNVQDYTQEFRKRALTFGNSSLYARNSFEVYWWVA
jgi:hypothetical protein